MFYLERAEEILSLVNKNGTRRLLRNEEENVGQIEMETNIFSSSQTILFANEGFHDEYCGLSM